MSKPKFDSSKPYDVVPNKPKFDATQPYGIDDQSLTSKDEISSEPTDIPESIEAGLSAATRAITLGTSPYISAGIEAVGKQIPGLADDAENKKSLLQLYKDLSERNIKREQQLSEKYPITSTSTELISGLAPVSKIGATATGAIAAASSSPYSLPKSYEKIAEGDIMSGLEEAGSLIKDTAVGAAGGFALGKVGEKLGKGYTALKGSGDKLAKKAEELALMSTKATPAQIAKFDKNAGRELLDRGIVKAGDTVDDVFQKLEKLHLASEEGIGNSLKQIDDLGVKINTNDIVKILEDRIGDLKAHPPTVKIAGQIESILQDIKNGPATLKPSYANKIKSDFQSQSNYLDPDATQAKKIVADAYRTATEGLAMTVDPKLADVFKENKKIYGLLAPIKDATEKASLKESQKSAFGIGRIAKTAAGASVGGPAGAVAAAAADVLVTPRIASTAATTADKLSKAIKSSPEKLGKYADMLQSLAQKGSRAIAVQSFIQSQRDPEYRKMIENLDNEDTNGGGNE